MFAIFSIKQMKNFVAIKPFFCPLQQLVYKRLFLLFELSRPQVTFVYQCPCSLRFCSVVQPVIFHHLGTNNLSVDIMWFVVILHYVYQGDILILVNLDLRNDTELGSFDQSTFSKYRVSVRNKSLISYAYIYVL